MNEFSYRNDLLNVEKVSIKDITKKINTPFYVYSSEQIKKNFYNLNSSLSNKCSIFYSVKANSNLAVIKTLSNLGAGMDVVSIGEYLRVKKAGVNEKKIIFSGVGKTRNELEKVIIGGIKQINVESLEELLLLNKIANQLNQIVPISFRVNPDIDAETHEKISTGKAENKFGINWNDVRKVYKEASDLNNVKVIGIDFHIGSQLTSLVPFRKAFEKVANMVKTLKSDGHSIDFVDIGGGLGIKYNKKVNIPTYQEYGKLIDDIFGKIDCEIEIEPGRSLVGNAGILICSVIYFKKGDKKNFLIVDGAMNDLLRPSLYDAYHEIICVEKKHYEREKLIVDIVGPVCETGDFFAVSREFPEMLSDDLIAVCDAGAYGAVMASEYNSRPLIPEILVNNNHFCVIRNRPKIKKIISRDKIPKWIND